MKTIRKINFHTIFVILIILVLIGGTSYLLLSRFDGGVFNSKRALADVETQVALGARTPGSSAHKQVGDWILTELASVGWDVEEQAGETSGHPIRNLIAKRGSGRPWYIFGAHYDSRLVADHDADPARRVEAVPGANDGASGVAILLELARSLPDDLPGQIWLVFFDAEDQGNLQGWDWILGSQFFADNLESNPDGIVVVDMIGDADLTIYKERNSDLELSEAIWETADQAGFGEQFLPVYKYQMLDDHLPFLERGIPAALLIDFDYPWWHTTSDTLDKVSAASLDAVGETLYRWILQTMANVN